MKGNPIQQATRVRKRRSLRINGVSFFSSFSLSSPRLRISLSSTAFVIYILILLLLLLLICIIHPYHLDSLAASHFDSGRRSELVSRDSRKAINRNDKPQRATRIKGRPACASVGRLGPTEDPSPPPSPSPPSPP